MTNAVKQVIATDKDGARLSPEQLAEAGVKPGEVAVVEIRQYTKADFERDHAGDVHETVDAFQASLDEYCRLPDGAEG